MYKILNIIIISILSLNFIGAQTITPIQDEISSSSTCDFINPILLNSQDAFTHEVFFETSGGNIAGTGTSVRNNFARRVDLVATNLVDGSSNTINLSSQNMEGNTSIVFDESILDGFSDGLVIVELDITYSRNPTQSFSNDPLLMISLNGPLLTSFKLTTTNSVRTISSICLFNFNYLTCPEVSLYEHQDQVRANVQGGSGNFEYIWAIDGQVISSASNRDFVNKICGLHDYSVTVIDLDRGCSEFDELFDVYKLCQNVISDTPQCILSVVQPIAKPNALGEEFLVWPPVQGAADYSVTIRANDPDCCEEEGPQTTIIFLVNNLISPGFKIPTNFSCFSIVINARCPDGTSGSSTEKFCSNALPTKKPTPSPNANGRSKAMQSIGVYPNPASDIINLSMELPIEDGEVRVLDIMGRTVINQSINNESNITLSTDALKTGTYILQVYNEIELLKTEKVIIID